MFGIARTRQSTKPCLNEDYETSPNEIMGFNWESESTADSIDSIDSIETRICGPELQRHYGPQSRRGEASQLQLRALGHCSHARACFEQFAKREEDFMGKWAVFYHSYSSAAVLYEVHAALAGLLFGFPSAQASLPRIQMQKFRGIDATSMKVRQRKGREPPNLGYLDYDETSITAMCSLVSTGPEASTARDFVSDRKQAEEKKPYGELLETLLSGILAPKNTMWKNLRNGGSQPLSQQVSSEQGGGVPKKDVSDVKKQILTLADQFRLDTSLYVAQGTHQGAQKAQRPGHLLQIFIRRDLVDDLAYASEPSGALDEKREPFSEWLNSDASMNHGQSRIVADPEAFLAREKCASIPRARIRPSRATAASFNKS
jgi:hypothetical protein